MIVMDDIKDVFFTPESKEKITVGDYYYRDGTLSHKYQEIKECLGIVFNTGNSIGIDQYPYGSVVALSDAKKDSNLLHLWRNVMGNITASSVKDKNDRIEYIIENLRTDYGGLFYSQSIVDDEYIAINIAKNFHIELPAGKTSGWYLPSSGQMWQIAHRFVNNDNYEEQKTILNLADKYMVSQVREGIYPLTFNIKKKDFKYEEVDRTFLIRPVFSF